MRQLYTYIQIYYSAIQKCPVNVRNGHLNTERMSERDKQIDRDIHRETHRETHTETHRETHTETHVRQPYI